ncbi:MAG: phenylacetate--CoA ligase [Thermoplasmatales archaeon]|nr:phenylacetate--CoA ligase [Thermoplasmatales archaeon]
MKFWDEKIETMPLEELKKLQLRRLKKVVKIAYERNEIYHRKFDEKGIKPSDIKSLDDLSKLPFLTKEEMRNYYPFGLLCVQLDDCVELHASSGTTGKPVVNVYTRKDIEIWADVMARALWANGLRKNDIMQNSYGYGLFTGAHGFEKGAQKIGSLVIPVSSGNTKRQINIMKDFGATSIACTPSYALYMAEVAEEMGFCPREDFSLRLGFFGAEAWSDEMRRKIEEKWGIRACEHYGLTEIIGPGVVSECEEKKLHINADHFLPEIIDPKTGERIEEGEGELVFTTLTKEAFPAIRFRTRDIASYSEEKCICGRTLPIQSRIKGRSDDMMKVKGVIVFPSQIEEAIIKAGGSENYQIVKKKEGEISTLLVRVEGEDEGIAKRIEDEIYTMLSLHIPVEIAKPGSLPRSEGKAKRIVEE